MTDNRLLRFALRLDAVASGALGIGMLVFASRLDDWLGMPMTLTVGVGVFMLAFAAALAGLAARPRIPSPAVWVVIVGNLGWVVASVALALAEPLALTTLGTVFVLTQAVAVVAFAELEYVGLRRAQPRVA